MNTENKEDVKKKGWGKWIAAALITLLLAGGAAIGTHFIRQSMGYLTTDNARVTTTLVAVTPTIPGLLERFDLYEGRYVNVDEVLGWVAGDEAMRSPVDGLVIHTAATRGQLVMPGETLAIIADTNNVHIQANIEETDIKNLRIGQPVTVTIDTFGNREFTGYISEINRITTAELSGQAMFFNTGGNFTRVTHLIPIEIIITDDVNLDNFIGVNARVRIPLRSDESDDFVIPPVGINNRITARGVVESVESRNVYSLSGLCVERVYVQAGDTVNEGQVLAVLDTEDLWFAIEQQTVALTLARQINETTLADAQRMLEMAERNLANNTNMMILHAEAALSTAEMHLAELQKNREIALLDYETGNDLQTLGTEAVLQQAESILLNARVNLMALIDTHERLLIMYNAGFLAREELRQSEIAVAVARNQYNDAETAVANASTTHTHSFVQQNRSLVHIDTMIESAETARRIARTLLNAERTAAGQEIERLRSAVTNAEAAANVGQLEISLRQLERQLQNATITSPINGKVTAVYVRQGSIASGLMFVIEDLDALRIITAFRENDIGRITVGTEVMIISDGTGDTVHTGIINRINPAAVPHSPIVEFETEIIITSTHTDLRLGMTARIDVVINREE
jgi:multidrug resistance efflux pump